MLGPMEFLDTGGLERCSVESVLGFACRWCQQIIHRHFLNLSSKCIEEGGGRVGWSYSDALSCYVLLGGGWLARLGV